MYKSIIQNKARRVKGRATTRIERDKRFCDKCKVSLHLTRYVLREGHFGNKYQNRQRRLMPIVISYKKLGAPGFERMMGPAV